MRTGWEAGCVLLGPGGKEAKQEDQSPVKPPGQSRPGKVAHLARRLGEKQRLRRAEQFVWENCRERTFQAQGGEEVLGGHA